MHKYCLFSHNWLALKINNEHLRMQLGRITGSVYDLGCGERPYEADILAHASRYIGVDWSNTLHGLCADVVCNLNEPLPLADAVADTVVALSLLEHLCEPQLMLNEAYRILKPGGAMVLQVPWQWAVHEAPYDYFRYTPYGLKYLLEKAGFVDVTVESQSGFFTMWILKFNYFTLRLIRGPKPLRGMIRLCLVPFWFLGQVMAPWLDKLDNNWVAETGGYFVTAHKSPRP